MAQSPAIRTERLLITPFAERHLSVTYVSWLNDRALMRYSEQRHRAHTIESCREYWRSFADTPHYFWALEETANGLGHIGNMNAYVNQHNSLADLGILIGSPQARGQGYGPEAWSAVCHFLFEALGLRKITAGVLAVNRPMLRLAETVGMVEDGIRRRQYVCDGVEVDVIHLALFRETWHEMEPVLVAQAAHGSM
jgi:RimJ/RimL family protein N-acetyltransferase